mmetsp:Transcript_37514/g.85120  ORF Transcript_37514/g.85120 Transcript_37514/m.85120 type:complete len:259 (+) Transcript_37514:478-1254(+)
MTPRGSAQVSTGDRTDRHDSLVLVPPSLPLTSAQPELNLSSTHQASLPLKSAAVIGVEKKPKLPSVTFWPSSLSVAQQSVSVITSNPFSYALRIVDSTQQLVRKPARTTVSMPFAFSCASRSVPGNASRPFLPVTKRSPSLGVISLQNSAFHVPAVNSLSFAQPARIPSALFGLSDASSANVIAACMTLTPAFLHASATSADLDSMPVVSMMPLTPPFNFPPSVVNSFWYSMKTMAALLASNNLPPFAPFSLPLLLCT